jgi:hypothetical protein
MPALWSEHYSSWRLMCGSEYNGLRSSGSQHFNIYTTLIYSNRNGLQPGAGRDQTIVNISRILHGDLADARTRQRSQHEIEPLCKARTDDKILRVSDGAADPTQIGRKYLT